MVSLEDLIGTWKIESCEARYLDGRIGPHPVGEGARGYILYNPDGYMSLEIMAERRLPFNEQDPFAATEEEYLSAYRSHLSYSGTFAIRGEEIIHAIEVSSYPNFIGECINRHVRIEEDRQYQTTQPFFIHGESQTIHFELIRVNVCARV